MAAKRSMTTAEAGRKRWDGISVRERSRQARERAQERERRRRRLREAAQFALKELEEVSAVDEDGSRLSVGCLRAITKLKEALA